MSTPRGAQRSLRGLEGRRVLLGERGASRSVVGMVKGCSLATLARGSVSFERKVCAALRRAHLGYGARVDADPCDDQSDNADAAQQPVDRVLKSVGSWFWLIMVARTTFFTQSISRRLIPPTDLLTARWRDRFAAPRFGSLLLRVTCWWRRPVPSEQSRWHRYCPLR